MSNAEQWRAWAAARVADAEAKDPQGRKLATDLMPLTKMNAEVSLMPIGTYFVAETTESGEPIEIVKRCADHRDGVATLRQCRRPTVDLFQKVSETLDNRRNGVHVSSYGF